ncbi:MAG: hypothetical protein QW666_01140 [Candidatus Woesearchaeota archaeon]
MGWEKQDLVSDYKSTLNTKLLYSDEAISSAGKIVSEDTGLAGRVEEFVQKFCNKDFLKKGLAVHINEIRDFYSSNPNIKLDLSALALHLAMKKDREAPDYHEYIFIVHPIMIADYIYKKQSKRKKYFGPIGSLLNKLMYSHDQNRAGKIMIENFGYHVIGLKEIMKMIIDFQNKFNFSINREAIEKHKKEKQNNENKQD